MMGILLVAKTATRVQERTSGHVVATTNNPLQLGEYDVNDDPWVHRLISHSVSGREDAFRNGIRARDGRCVMSGMVNRVAHIFPLEKGDPVWIQGSYGRWITDIDDTNGVSKINSLQNGILLRRDIHGIFDRYLLSVNPEDGYKVVVFGDDTCRIPNDPHRVSDELLRWHFRQSVLANMRGVGEPIFEHDFLPGTDMMGEIREGPYAKEQLEMEFSARLRMVV
ncbi:hypothetical protein BDD12DRAFT_918718 [Trichophaea hybrida]|nr:hypothetical protein BDD12DRAFT_918718 [Trichophaea hybrida]